MKEKCYCVYREDAYGKNKLLYVFKKKEDAEWYAYTTNNTGYIIFQFVTGSLIFPYKMDNGKEVNSVEEMFFVKENNKCGLKFKMS